MTPEKERPVVLLAEDDGDLRELIAERLTKEGMRVIELEDGFALREYLELCRIGGDVPQPDVVVTDVRMPHETGPQALAEGIGRAPFVLITSCLDSETRSIAERAGAAAVFEKPFPMKDLVGVLRRVTSSRKDQPGNSA
jgi:two-component system, OmpR family, response regulator